jgi:hypothetical protein
MNEKTQTEPQQPPQPQQAPPTMKCFIIPIDAMEQIRDALREAPYKAAHPILATMSTLQVADVPIAPQKPG